MARTPFKLKSGNATPFKSMGSSPVRDNGKKSWEEAYKVRDMDLYGNLNLEEFKTEGKRQIADVYKTVPKIKMTGSLTPGPPEETPKTFKEKVQARQKKYNPEGKSMHEQKLEKVKGTGQWKRMSKFEQKAHKRKIERAKASRVKKQEAKTTK